MNFSGILKSFFGIQNAFFRDTKKLLLTFLESQIGKGRVKLSATAQAAAKAAVAAVAKQQQSNNRKSNTKKQKQHTKQKKAMQHKQQHKQQKHKKNIKNTKDKAQTTKAAQAEASCANSTNSTNQQQNRKKAPTGSVKAAKEAPKAATAAFHEKQQQQQQQEDTRAQKGGAPKVSLGSHCRFLVEFRFFQTFFEMPVNFKIIGYLLLASNGELINCKIVLDILEGQEGKVGFFNGRRPKSGKKKAAAVVLKMSGFTPC